MNVAYFLGNFVRDMKIETTDNGKKYLKNAIAINSGSGDNRKTDFFNVIAWNKTAENIATYFKKGNKILLTTMPQQHTWTDKDNNKHSEVFFMITGFDFVEKKQEATLPPAPDANSGFMDISSDIELQFQ